MSQVDFCPVRYYELHPDLFPIEHALDDLDYFAHCLLPPYDD